METNKLANAELDISASTNESDIDELATMNACLIIDEGHSYRLHHDQLVLRMRGWLADGYIYRIIRTQGGETVGYALWQEQSDHLFLRQFFIKDEFRRLGYGSFAFKALRQGPWNSWSSIRLDVLHRNERAKAFWQALGFGTYAHTLELRSDS